MNEADMMHGRNWRGEDLTGWLLTEKLRGCRAFWDGAVMWLRSGRTVALPAAWRASLPATPLDGELWDSEGKDEQVASDAARFGRFAPSVRFGVFDAPGAEVWPARLARARAAVAGCPVAFAVEEFAFQTLTDLQARLVALRRAAGEGFVARHPLNRYAAGRTGTILKVKGLPHLPA
jgi:DNA ligase-1